MGNAQRRYVHLRRTLVNPIGNGTSVVLRLSFNGWLGKLMGRLGRTLILEYLDMEASGLKKAVESLHC